MEIGAHCSVLLPSGDDVLEAVVIDVVEPDAIGPGGLGVDGMPGPGLGGGSVDESEEEEGGGESGEARLGRKEGADCHWSIKPEAGWLGEQGNPAPTSEGRTAG